MLPCVDHTTVENLGQQNAFISSLNTVTPGSISVFVPIFSHDQKDNWQHSKIVAKNPLAQLNDMLDQEKAIPFHLRVKPLPEGHKIPKLKPSYVQMKHFCPLCHDQLESDSYCSNCFNNKNDQENMIPIQKKYKCSEDWGKRQFASKKEKRNHTLIYHPDLFDAKAFYARMHSKHVSRTTSIGPPLNLPKRRKLNPKYEPDVITSLSDIINPKDFLHDEGWR